MRHGSVGMCGLGNGRGGLTLYPIGDIITGAGAFSAKSLRIDRSGASAHKPDALFSSADHEEEHSVCYSAMNGAMQALATAKSPSNAFSQLW
jgi:hypothetical protein